MFLRLLRVASAARAVARAGVSGEEAARAAAWAGAGAPAGGGAPGARGGRVADVAFWAGAPAAVVPPELLLEAAGWENSWTAEWEGDLDWGDEGGCACAHE